MPNAPRLFCFLLLTLLTSVAPAFAASGIAMHGAPKYGPGFTHFSYVNPAAPKGGTLRLGTVGTFDSLNPFIVRGTAPNAAAFSLASAGPVYESLMARSWDEPFSLYGLIAEEIETPEDRSSVTFTLNSKARWQDGEPITAEDVIFSHKTLRDQGRPNHRTYYKKVAKVEKLGPRKVRFTFAQNPDGSWDREMPLIIGLMPILPEHEWKDRVFNQTTLRIPVGSGPYKITKVDPGRSVTLTRDPDYWGKDLPAMRGMYNFDEVILDYYRDDNIALQAFKAAAFDLRRELDPRKWATAYDVPAVQDGKIKLGRFTHGRTEKTEGFVLNLRRPLFRDPALREAVSLAFDFGWINKALFRGMFKRTESFFPNAELAAPAGPPRGLERTILEKYRKQVPPSLFTKSVRPPDSDGSFEARRDHLLEAAAVLEKAGYVLKDGLLYTPGGAEAVRFEVMLADPTEEKIALEWARNLKRLGIDAQVRTVDSAQYQARLTSFDYDVTTAKWYNSLSPGNEQIYFWGCAAASQQGSRNYPGVCDPVVDALAKAIPAARTREGLVATTRALDRVLMAGHYIVPFYYLGADLIAYWATRLALPSTTPIYGPILEAWWGEVR